MTNKFDDLTAKYQRLQDEHAAPAREARNNGTSLDHYNASLVASASKDSSEDLHRALEDVTLSLNASDLTRESN